MADKRGNVLFPSDVRLVSWRPVQTISVATFLTTDILNFHFALIHVRLNYFPEHFVSNICNSHSCAQYETPFQHHTKQRVKSLFNLLCTISKKRTRTEGWSRLSFPRLSERSSSTTDGRHFDDTQVMRQLATPNS